MKGKVVKATGGEIAITVISRGCSGTLKGWGAEG
jgi:hypothetical protein